jgi:hypothetical protein
MQTLPDFPASVARDESAMAAVAALHPVDAFEARLAAEIVAADAQAMDSFRLASQYCNEVAATLRCRAQGAAMMRQMQSALRTLINMQSVRRRAAAEMQPAAPPKDAMPQSEPRPDPIAVAESYATTYPDRASCIRSTRLSIPEGNRPTPTGSSVSAIRRHPSAGRLTAIHERTATSYPPARLPAAALSPRPNPRAASR